MTSKSRMFNHLLALAELGNLGNPYNLEYSNRYSYSCNKYISDREKEILLKNEKQRTLSKKQRKKLGLK